MDNMDAIRATVDEHGRIINEHGDLIDGLSLVVLGDGSKRVRGLLERTDNLEKLAQELGAWRHDINTSIRMGLIYLRILVALLGLVGLAAWQAPLSAIIAAISGG